MSAQWHKKEVSEMLKKSEALKTGIKTLTQP